MWADITTFTLGNAWKMTVPVDGEYFKVVHENVPPGGKYEIAQASVAANGKTELFDFREVDPENSEEIFYFKKPVIFSSRRVAIRRVATPESLESQVRRTVNPDLLKKPPVPAFISIPLPWKVRLQVSSVLEPALAGMSGSGGTPNSGVTSQKVLAYQSPGDTNGVCYWIGTNYGTEAWVNPHIAGRVRCSMSSREGGVPQDLVNRSSNADIYTTNYGVPWMAIDLGETNKLKVNHYSLQNRDSNYGNVIRNWKLQGTNSAESNLVYELNEADWIDIDVRTNDSTISNTPLAWGSFSVSNSDIPFRWLRILMTSVDSSGDYYLVINEWEFYGTLEHRG